MSAILLSGKELASKLEENQKLSVRKLQEQGVYPKLSVIMVGDNSASAIYVRNKARACERIGILSETIHLPQDTTQEELLQAIDHLNADASVHGILIQLPLPAHLDEAAAMLRVSPPKDVDGFHIYNAGKLFLGEKGLRPCTPQGIVCLLHSADIPMDGAHAVIIGRSNIVGKPTALMLMQENCTVTVCHSHTKGLSSITRQADILVAAVGKPCFVKADMVKPGAAVIDVGINRVDGKIVGDVDFAAVSDAAGYITPVPGGVGPMTVSMLMENTLEAAWMALR